MSESNPVASSDAMESVQHESRSFPPPSGFASQAHIRSMEQYEQMHRESLDDPDKFWGEKAAELSWFKKWSRVLEWNLPDAKWFIGGKLNACYNCVDRQVEAGLGEKTAIVWEGEPLENGKPEVRKLTFADLKHETSRFANVLKGLGVKKGDRVTLYMP
ncbi:MAG: acetyl-coenzyme A synthetase N-terminal domain-containing protein, partial [Phycisphaeraceae bacterium]